MNDLQRSLAVLAEKSNAEWQHSLSDRKRLELDFHDEHRMSSKSDADDNKKYYSVSTAVHEYVVSWIRNNSSGRVFLDYACGNGTYAVMAAEAGAELAVGIDISKVSVENARKNAEKRGLTNTFFVQGDCENTQLPSDSIDAVVCSGMLHHLDLSYAFPELRRILKPGGKVLAMEALNYNPIIKLYRRFTPRLRTTWEKEHILSLADVTFASRFFTVENIRFWNLWTLAAVPFRGARFFPTALKALSAIDWMTFKTPLKYMAWMFTFELVKRK